jgi:DNA-methyltransferase (dcm)
MLKNNRTVSLFSGIGGLDLGFIDEGFDVIWANDFDLYATKTYAANIDSNICCGDIRELKKNIPPHDILIGGFPCQPFSSLGNLKGFEDEKRGNLFFEIIDIAKQHQPKVICLENVKTLKTHDNGKTFKRINYELEQIGYSVNSQILNSADYGVPQRRNRIFIVAIRRDSFSSLDFVYPEKEPLTVTTQDLLEKEVDKKYFLSKKVLPTIMGTGTKGFSATPTIDQPISKTLTATMHKMHRAYQDNYFTDRENRSKFVDDSKSDIRKLTPDECRKLQGFPDGWKYVVSDTQAYKQFGNAVTVNVSRAVAHQIKEFMEKN